jgi:hypothetical protein
MRRLRIPGPDDLAAEPQLASLLFLEVALVLAAGALRATHPDMGDDFDPGETDEVTTGRVLLNECCQLRDDLDDYRRRVLARLARQNGDWPF